MIGRIIGPYQIVKEIGKGGMGTVYLGYESKLDRNIALKVILANEEAVTPEKIKSFIAEARSAASIEHPNIVQIYSAGWDSDQVYFAMRYVRGKNLAEMLIEEGALTPRKAINYLLPITDALMYVHKKGLIHRDIKPANIIIDETGRPMLADFGLAMNANTRLEATGTVYGTMQYMSPEQYRNQRLDYRTDVYSLGITFYELVVGKTPFHRLSKLELANAVVNKTPAPPSQIAPDLPEELSRLIVRMIEKDPEKRVKDEEELNQLMYRLSRNPQLDLLNRPAPHTSNVIINNTAISSDKTIVDTGISVWDILLEHISHHPFLYIVFIILLILVIVLL